MPNNRFERDAAKSAAPLKRIVRARAIVGVGSMFKKGGDYETATLLLLVAVFLVVGYSFAQQQVERKGVTSTVKLEGSEAKPYQVRQVRAVILKYRLGGQES